MLRLFAFLFLMSIAVDGVGQVHYQNLEPQKRNAFLQDIYSLHPVFPLYSLPDSSFKDYHNQELPEFLHLFRNPYSYTSSKTPVLKIAPSLNFIGGSDVLNNDFRYDAGIGVKASLRIKEALDVNATYRYHQYAHYAHIESYEEQHRALPGGPLPSGNNYHDLRFDITWRASQYFHFRGGFEEHFIGNGYRSLMLSDAGYPYPFFSMQTNIWHFNYTAMWINMKDFRNPAIKRYSDFKNKYAAIHYLSWQMTPRWRAGFYEAIIWQGTNEQGKRGLEINYLNPVIFFRPVEFAIGSPDNAMMGFDMDYQAGNQLFYFQLMLDEFKFEEMKAMNGWWGNKQAFQVGWRSFNVFGEKNLHSLTEFNYIRPFMYSHRTPLQSYGNYNQPLAHPSGANVMEGVFQITYSRNRVYLALKNTFSLFGSSPEGENYGGNIFLDYNTRSKEYNNYVGQGVENKLQNHVAELSYLLNKDNNLSLFLRSAYRSHTIEGQSHNGLFFEAGISNTYGAAGNSWVDY